MRASKLELIKAIAAAARTTERGVIDEAGKEGNVKNKNVLNWRVGGDALIVIDGHRW